MATHICAKCGKQGTPTSTIKGNIILEIFLWLMFLLPGIIYTLWRLSTRKYSVCPSCSAQEMLPLDSPMGRKLAADLGAAEPAPMVKSPNEMTPLEKMNARF